MQKGVKMKYYIRICLSWNVEIEGATIFQEKLSIYLSIYLSICFDLVESVT